MAHTHCTRRTIYPSNTNYAIIIIIMVIAKCSHIHFPDPDHPCHVIMNIFAHELIALTTLFHFKFRRYIFSHLYMLPPTERTNGAFTPFPGHC